MLGRMTMVVVCVALVPFLPESWSSVSIRSQERHHNYHATMPTAAPWNRRAAAGRERVLILVATSTHRFRRGVGGVMLMRGWTQDLPRAEGVMTATIMTSDVSVGGEGDRRGATRPEWLDTAREWMRAGGSVAFFGPRGSGKTASIDALVASAGSRILRCCLDADDGKLPYGSLGRLIESMSAVDSGLRSSALADIRASMAEAWAGALRASSTGADQNRSIVCQRLQGLVRDLTVDQSLLIVIDDLHRIDEASADVLAWVASHVDDRRVHLVVAELVEGEAVPVRRGLAPSPLLRVQLGR
jgi:hypothetical protein